MPYTFIDRYCKLTANLPELGIVVITGWIIQADELNLLILDENNNYTLIKREQLIGSIVVLLEQPEPGRQIKERFIKEQRGVLSGREN